MTVVEQIQEKYPFLTKKQREVAAYMVADPERMSYTTLKEISRDTGITEMTILKTCDSLGFASFSDLKYEFRKYAAQQVEQLRSTLKQDPREIVQGLLNSGQMSQQQFNMLAQQANQIMSQMRGNK